MKESTDFVSSWVAHQRWSIEHLNKASLADSPYFWAEEHLSKMVEEDPEKAWQEVLKIYASTTEPEILACLAAGPLEDLLVKHGAMLIDRIEVVAKEDRVFGELLCGVWRNAIDDSVWQRLVRAIPPNPRKAQ